VWYRARLRHIVATARVSVEPQLRKFIKAAVTPENAQLAPHLALAARNIVMQAAGSYQFRTPPVAIATAAAKMNLSSVDKSVTSHLKSVIGVAPQFPTPQLRHQQIVEAVRPLNVGDASTGVGEQPRSKRSLLRQAIAQQRPSIKVAPQIKYGASDKMQSTAMQQIKNNVALIKSIPQQYFDRLASDVYDSISQAQRWETLADTLTETLDYDGEITVSRANLIARDQTSKMTAAFNEERQTSVGITSYQWQTMEDERVRETHADNDGQVFDWDSPPEETGHPGNDVNCRCVALAVAGEMAA
jgi:SPP1 gp7 family putative phage head morphogenesis protein